MLSLRALQENCSRGRRIYRNGVWERWGLGMMTQEQWFGGAN